MRQGTLFECLTQLHLEGGETGIYQSSTLSSHEDVVLEDATPGSPRLKLKRQQDESTVWRCKLYDSIRTRVENTYDFTA